MQGCADLFDVASHTSLKGSEFLSFMQTMFCLVPVLPAQCVELQSVSWGDESGM